MPQSHIWASTIPLLITHPESSEADIPYLIQVPRLSYLPLLLPRLTTFFGPAKSFHYEGILLTNLPVGLLCDLYQPELPWRLQLGNGPLFDVHDSFINSVKEADFVRNGTAKGIMSMSKDHSKQLWNSVQDNDLQAYLPVQAKLLNPPTPLRNIPIRIYVPSRPSSGSSLGKEAISESKTESSYSFRVIQNLIPPDLTTGGPNTLGHVLNTLLPSLFPSRRDAILAEAVLHGAPVPFTAPLEELMREAAYADGWLHICVWMLV